MKHITNQQKQRYSVSESSFPPLSVIKNQSPGIASQKISCFPPASLFLAPASSAMDRPLATPSHTCQDPSDIPYEYPSSSSSSSSSSLTPEHHPAFPLRYCLFGESQLTRRHGTGTLDGPAARLALSQLLRNTITREEKRGRADCLLHTQYFISYRGTFARRNPFFLRAVDR
jgi:hypothetical protein